MLIDLLDILKIAGIYTAVIFGAGVASGQEMLNYFVTYGRNGFYGIILSGIIFAFVGYAVLNICYKKKINSATVFSELIYGKFSILIEIIIGVFLFVVYATMLSASGETFVQEFKMPKLYGMITMAMLCYVTYSLGENFFARLNLFLTPVLLFGTIFISLYMIFTHNLPHVDFIPQNTNWIKGSCLYASYNIIPGISVIVPMINTVKNKKNAKHGTVLGGFFLTILGFAIAGALFLNFSIASVNQIPMLAITNRLNNYFIKISYNIVFILALFTTAIGNFFSLCEWLKRKDLKHTKIICTICALIFSQIKFSSFVSKIFPVFGYIGFFEIIIITIFYLIIKLSD